MKTLLAFTLVLLAVGTFYGQCNYEDIFPVSQGSSKFQATAKIAQSENIIIDEEKNRFSLDNWKHFDYLEGDSVYVADTYYHYKNHPCFKGMNKELNLSFADNKLYQISIRFTFARTDFKSCIKNYNSLVSIFKEEFKYSEQFTLKSRKTGEQLGKGFKFRNYEESSEAKLKELEIEYAINYDSDFINGDLVYNGNIDSFEIVISYTNLNGTKFTKKGFSSSHY